MHGPGIRAREEDVASSAMAPVETRTPAIVVRVRAFGESDKIVTFLSRDLGKVTGIAKGAKRSRRRFVNVLEPFTHVVVRLRLRPSSDLAFIATCELLDARPALARDLGRFAHGSYMLELVDRMIRGREAGPESYELLNEALALARRLAEQARESEYLHTGEMTAVGKLRCTDCGEEMSLHTPGPIPPCPACQGTRFSRVAD